jgi:hypothetical protein
MSRPAIIQWTLTLVAVTLFGGACESRSDAVAQSAASPKTVSPLPPPQPCMLITAEEVQAILGKPFTARLTRRGGTPICEYAPTSNSQTDGFTLTVYWTGGKEALAVTKAGTRIAKAAMKATQVDPMSMMALEPIDDLGDEAYFNPMLGASVLKGDALLEFDIRAMMWNQTMESGKELWKKLATTALSRL